MDTNGGGHDSNFKLLVPLVSMAAHLLATGSSKQRTSLEDTLNEFCACYFLEASSQVVKSGKTAGVGKVSDEQQEMHVEYSGSSGVTGSVPATSSPQDMSESKTLLPDFCFNTVVSLFLMEDEQWQTSRLAFLQSVATYGKDVAQGHLAAGSGVISNQRRSSLSSAFSLGQGSETSVRDATMPALRILIVVDQLRQLRGKGPNGLVETILQDEHGAIQVVSDICNLFEQNLLSAKSEEEILRAGGFSDSAVVMWNSQVFHHPVQPELLNRNSTQATSMGEDSTQVEANPTSAPASS